MSNLLAGRLALVTGAGSGIGQAVAQLFAKEGACVIAAGFDTQGTVESLPEVDHMAHTAHEVDVSCETSVKDLMDQMFSTYQKPATVAVNCAGITKDSFMIKMTSQQFDDVINVNLKGTFLVSKYLTKMLLRTKQTNASIVNIASIVGKTGNMGQTNYAASKAGVIGLTKSTALEYGSYGIRCNAILPGFIETAMTAKVPEKVMDQFRDKIPMKRFGQPVDVAQACLFLASDQSSYVTGSCLEVTGGLGA